MDLRVVFGQRAAEALHVHALGQRREGGVVVVHDDLFGAHRLDERRGQGGDVGVAAVGQHKGVRLPGIGHALRGAVAAHQHNALALVFHLIDHDLAVFRHPQVVILHFKNDGELHKAPGKDLRDVGRVEFHVPPLVDRDVEIPHGKMPAWRDHVQAVFVHAEFPQGGGGGFGAVDGHAAVRFGDLRDIRNVVHVAVGDQNRVRPGVGIDGDGRQLFVRPDVRIEQKARFAVVQLDGGGAVPGDMHGVFSLRHMNYTYCNIPFIKIQQLVEIVCFSISDE